MEHASESGVQLSGDEAYDDQVTYFYKSREGPSRKPSNPQHRVVQGQVLNYWR